MFLLLEPFFFNYQHKQVILMKLHNYIILFITIVQDKWNLRLNKNT